jgi:tRNA threonylcarbamoyladenosine biosynthesis protein TsaE
VEETERAALGLAEVILRAGDAGMVIGLEGRLGAGKTAFVRGLARGLGLDVGQVASPTFVIANEYRATEAGQETERCLVHVDFYRLEREDELWSSGFEDFFQPGAVVAVEWANRFPGALPAQRLEVKLLRSADRPEEWRQLEAVAKGDEAEQVLTGWVEWMAAFDDES